MTLSRATLVLFSLVLVIAQGSDVNFIFADMFNRLNDSLPLKDVMELEANLTIPLGCSASGVTGTASIYVTAAGSLRWVIQWSGLVSAPVSVALRGPAYPGQTGKLQVDLTGGSALPPNNPLVGWTYITQQQATQLKGGLWYVEIVAQPCPGGVLRGTVSSIQTFSASLPPLDEVVALTCQNANTCFSEGSGGTANATLHLDQVTRVLTYTIDYAGIPSSIATVQLCGPATPPDFARCFLALPLTVSGGAQLSGIVVLSATQVQQYLDGKLSLTLSTTLLARALIGFIGGHCPQFSITQGSSHSTTTGGGTSAPSPIISQVVPLTCSAAGTCSATASNPIGSAALLLDVVSGAFSYTITLSGLTSDVTALQLCSGSAPCLDLSFASRACSSAACPFTGLLILTPAQVDQYQQGLMSIIVGTADLNPALKGDIAAAATN